MNAGKLESEGGVAALESARLERVRERHALLDRTWAEAALAGEKRVLEMIAGGHSLLSILDALCLAVEGTCRGSLCSILLLDVKGERLCQGVAPSLPKSYLEAFNGREIASCWGPCGAATFRKEQVIAADIQADALWDGCRDIVLSHGLRACWSAPILSPDGRVLGTLAILSREPCSPALEDQGIIKQFTHLASIAIGRARSQETLRQSEADLHEAQRLSHVGSWRHDLLTGKVKVSPEVHRIFQIQPHEDASDPQLYLGRVHPEDRQRVQELFDRCEREKIACQTDFRIVLPDGSIRHQHSVGRPILNQAGDAVEFVGTAMDVTEQKEAQEALHASEHLARGQVQALTSTLAALARQSDPDQLLEHVLRTVVEQTQAHSIAVWNRNEDGVRFDMIAGIEDDQYQTREEAICPARRLSMLPEHHPLWREVLRTGQHGMMDDLDKESAKMCVGSGDWRRMVEDVDPDPAFTILMNHLREMDVRAVLFVPIWIADNVAGTLAIRFQERRTFRREEIDLTRALAHQAMLALQLMRLSQQSRQAAVMAERNRVARDIHDTLAQGLTGVIVQLEAAEEAMSQRLMAKAGEHLARAGELARESLQEARRSVRALRPRALEEKDLCEALKALIQKMTEGTNLESNFMVRGKLRDLPPEWEENLLHVGQEVLTNVLRHSQASKFIAQIAFDDGEIRLSLRDNGRGFDPEVKHDGFGMQGMRERVEGLGGQLAIQSSRGQGTAVSIVLPLAKAVRTTEL